MAVKKASELGEVYGVVADDEIAIRRGSANYRVGCDIFTTGWRKLEGPTYSTSTTSRILMSDTSAVEVGMPIKWTNSASATGYGVIHAVTANTHIDIYGAPLNTGATLSNVYLRTADIGMYQMEFFVSGTYADGDDSTLLVTDLNRYYVWMLPTAYCVGFTCRHTGDDSTANPKVTLMIGGNALSTENTNTGPTVTTSWSPNSAVAINASNYEISRNDAIDLKVTQGTTGNAANLSVIAYFVFKGGLA